MKTFNKITISFTLLICLLFSYSLLYQVYLEQTGPIYDNTLRFHVRADSDKKEAQERKLIVRDAVLRYVKEDVYRADSAQKLKQNLAEKTEEIAQVAANASDGKPVRVYFTKERFPIRHYGTAIFPAGEYQALRVDIGKAAGHNWWCAFYPNLCYTPEKNFTLSESGKKQWKTGWQLYRQEGIQCLALSSPCCHGSSRHFQHSCKVPALEQPAERCQGNDAGSDLSARRSGSCAHQRQERGRHRRLRRAQNGES